MSTPLSSSLILRFAIKKTISNICFYHACMVFISDDWHVHTILHQSTWSAISVLTSKRTSYKMSRKWPPARSGRLKPKETPYHPHPPLLYCLRNHVVPTLVALHAILSWRLSLSVHSDESFSRQLSWANYSQKYRVGPWKGRVGMHQDQPP